MVDMPMSIGNYGAAPGAGVASPGGASATPGIMDWLASFMPQNTSANGAGSIVPPAATAPLGGVGAPPGNAGLGVGLGPNIGTLQGAVGGVSALGNLWTAWNATKLANESFNFNKQLSTDNYTNQAQSFNTELADRANARGVMENQTPAQTQSYIAANSLKTTI